MASFRPGSYGALALLFGRYSWRVSHYLTTPPAPSASPRYPPAGLLLPSPAGRALSLVAWMESQVIVRSGNQGTLLLQPQRIAARVNTRQIG